MEEHEITKRCGKCKKFLSIDRFYKNRKGKAKLNSYCKPCARQDIRDRTEAKLLKNIDDQRLAYAKMPDNTRPKDKACLNPNCGKAGQLQPPEHFRQSILTADGLSILCRFCGLVRTRTALSRHDISLYHKLWYQASRKSINQMSKEWRIAHPQQVKDLYIRRRFRQYGVTPEWYDQQLSRQRGVCAICGSVNPKSNGGSFHVDHNHKCCTKSCHACDKCRRGLLCGVCNTRLSNLEQKEWLTKALAYLAQYP